MGASSSKINNIDILISLLEYINSEEDILIAKDFRQKIIDNSIEFHDLKKYFKEDFDKLYKIIQKQVIQEPTENYKNILKELAIMGDLELINSNSDRLNNKENKVNIIKRQKYKKGEVIRFVNEENKWEYAEIFKYNYDYTYDLRNPITLKIINNIYENDLTIDLIERQSYKDNDNITYLLNDKYNIGKIVKYNGNGNYDIKSENSDDIISIHETKLKYLELTKNNTNNETKSELNIDNILTDIFKTFTKGIVEKINEYKPEIKNLLDSGINYLNETVDCNNLKELLDLVENGNGLFLKHFINTINKDYISYYNNPTLEEVDNNFELNLEQSNTNSIKYDNIRNITYPGDTIKFKSQLFDRYDDVVYDIKFDFGDGFKSFFEIFENIELYNLNNLEPEIKEERLSYRITNTHLLLFYMSDNLTMKLSENKKLLRIKYKGFYIKNEIKDKLKELCKLIYDFNNKLYFKKDGSILENLF